MFVETARKERNRTGGRGPQRSTKKNLIDFVHMINESNRSRPLYLTAASPNTQQGMTSVLQGAGIEASHAGRRARRDAEPSPDGGDFSPRPHLRPAARTIFDQASYECLTTTSAIVPSLFFLWILGGGGGESLVL